MWLFCADSILAQKIAPICEELSLSGSFAEIRRAHFHAGVDFRTGGAIGKRVVAVDDGYVSRVSVSPVGYGKAIYLNHPDGTTSVYAHLESFETELANAVYARQYAESSFAVDFMPADTIRYKKGEVIALSGNSGSSGGPHLHFEIRDTQSEVVMNSAHHIKVNDNLAPEIKGLYLYEVDMHGVERRRGAFALERSGNQYARAAVKVASGVIGVGLDIVDKMEGSPAKLGVYSLQVYADDILVSSYVADSITFAQNRYVNVVGDYEAYNSSSKTLYRTFGSCWNSVYGCSAEFDGYIGVERDSTVAVRVECADFNGNSSVLNFEIVGDVVRESRYEGVVWYSNENNEVRAGECRVVVPQGAMIRNLPVRPEKRFDSESGDVCFVLAESEEPLIAGAKVLLLGNYDKRAVVCTIGKKGIKRPLKSRWYVDSLVATTYVLGKYGVLVDTVAPSVRYRGVWRKGLSYYIADTHTSIGEISVFVNGEWTLYEYDAKNGAVIVNPKESSFVKGENMIEVRAVDAVGNDSTLMTIYNKV